MLKKSLRSLRLAELLRKKQPLEWLQLAFFLNSGIRLNSAAVVWSWHNIKQLGRQMV